MSNRLPFIVTLIVGACFGCAALVDYRHSEKVERVQHLALIKSMTLNVKPESVIGPNATFLGDENSPFTLVEFGDYECPPCRYAFKQLPEILRNCRGKVRFTFRNFPIVELHAHALAAAEAAEAARIQGRFWPVHDALYQTDLSLKSIDQVTRQQKLNRTRYLHDRSTSAEEVINKDKAEAKRLGVLGTPTFVLCCQNGIVLRLHSLDELSVYTGN